MYNLFKSKVKQGSDDSILRTAIPTRIAEIRRLPWTKGNQARIDALNTRLYSVPDEIAAQGRKAAAAWRDANPVPKFVADTLPAKDDHRIIRPNVMAGMLVSAADEKRGYKLKTA